MRKLLAALVRALHRLSLLGQETACRISNFEMYRQIGRFRPADPSKLRVLCISNSWELTRWLGFAPGQVTNTSYPEISLLQLPYEAGTFDFVISDQVLEHVEGNLKAAVDESLRVLKAGGIAVHTTCFMVPIHGTPGDYWRVSPSGMRWLVEDRAEVLQAAGWGNPLARLYSSLGANFLPIPLNRFHPLHWLATYNWPSWPISTWVVARKRPASGREGDLR
jgi:SAM-dependent methyltransferase